jgi:hypothetical protein
MSNVIVLHLGDVMSASRRIFPDVHDTTPSRYIQVLYKSQLSPEMPWHPPQWMGNSALRPDLPEHFAPDRCRWILPWRSAPPPLHFSSAHPALEPHMVVCMYVCTYNNYNSRKGAESSRLQTRVSQSAFSTMPSTDAGATRGRGAFCFSECRRSRNTSVSCRRE